MGAGGSSLSSQIGITILIVVNVMLVVMLLLIGFM